MASRPSTSTSRAILSNSNNRPRHWVSRVLSSLDVLVMVVALLDVKSIVRLSMVSKAIFNEIDSHRIIWIRALLALQAEECMMPFTYRLATMDAEALRRSACSPYRLSSAFLGRSPGRLSSQVFQLECGPDGPPPQFAVYLLPGGRWLIHTDRGLASRGGGPSRISCSDLSHITSRQPSQSFDLTNAAETWPTLHTVQSDPEFRRIVVVVSYLISFPTRCFEILHATWSIIDGDSSPLPTWSRIAYLEIDIEENVPSTVIEGDYVCIPLSGSVIIWQWRIGEWGTLSVVPRGIRGSWIQPPHLYVLDESTNFIRVFDFPPLQTTSQPMPIIQGAPTAIVQWYREPRTSCELVVLSGYKPLHLRAQKLCAIMFWSRGEKESYLRLLDYGTNPSVPEIVYQGYGEGVEDGFGVHSAALQTMDLHGIATRVGRRYLARLERGSHGLEFRVRAYSQASPIPSLVKFVVPMPGEWSQAEVYDTCTLFGRVMIREYDDSSDSEHSDDHPYRGLAVLDFIS